MIQRVKYNDEMVIIKSPINDEFKKGIQILFLKLFLKKNKLHLWLNNGPYIRLEDLQMFDGYQNMDNDIEIINPKEMEGDYNKELCHLTHLHDYFKISNDDLIDIRALTSDIDLSKIKAKENKAITADEIDYNLRDMINKKDHQKEKNKNTFTLQDKILVSSMESIDILEFGEVSFKEGKIVLLKRFDNGTVYIKRVKSNLSMFKNVQSIFNSKYKIVY